MEIILFTLLFLIFTVYLLIGFGLFSLMTFMRMFTGQVYMDGRDICAHWYIIFIWPFKKQIKWK